MQATKIMYDDKTRRKKSSTLVTLPFLLPFMRLSYQKRTRTHSPPTAVSLCTMPSCPFSAPPSLSVSFPAQAQIAGLRHFPRWVEEDEPHTHNLLQGPWRQVLLRRYVCMCVVILLCLDGEQPVQMSPSLSIFTVRRIVTVHTNPRKQQKPRLHCPIPLLHNKVSNQTTRPPIPVSPSPPTPSCLTNGTAAHGGIPSMHMTAITMPHALRAR